MYADLEEEALKRRKSAVSHSKRGHSEISSRRGRSPDSVSSSISRSVSRSLSPQPQRSNGRLQRRSELEDSKSPIVESDRFGKVLNAEERERELQEKLRRRALMSKRRKRSDSSSPLSRSRSRDSNDQRRFEQRRERRRGDLLDRKNYSESRSGRSQHRGSNYTRSPVSSRSRSRSRSPSRRRRESVGSRREGSRRMSPANYDDEYIQRRRKLVDRNEDGYDDPSAHRRDRDHRYAPYHDPYYDRRSNGRGGGGYYGPSRRGPDRYPPPGDYYDRPAPRSRHSRSPSPPPSSARRRRGESKAKTPDPDDYELRSVFCSQLAARLGQRDLGEFFEEKLGEGTVRDVRIVTDKNTGRSKG